MKLPYFDFAVRLAADAHLGQVDKAKECYLLHPLRVALRGTTEAERIVGVLHDAIEDGPRPEQLRREIRHNFGEEILEAIEAVSRREGETYEAFIERIALNPLAARVKLHDLADNLDPDRIASCPPGKRERYEKARTRLLEALGPKYSAAFAG